MEVLTCIGSHCTTFHTAGCACWFLFHFIWSRVPGLIDFTMDATASMYQVLCKSRTLTKIGLALGEESMGLKDKATILPMEKSKLTKTAKGARQVESMLIIFSDTKGIAYRGFVLADLTSIPHTTMRFYGDCVQIWEDFATNFGITTTHRLTLPFSPGVSDLRQCDCRSPSALLFCFPDWRQNEKPPFWHKSGDRGRIAGGAEYPHRTRLPGYILKTAEGLETVHKRGRELLQKW
jgi:hypothetical protein